MRALRYSDGLIRLALASGMDKKALPLLTFEVMDDLLEETREEYLQILENVEDANIYALEGVNPEAMAWLAEGLTRRQGKDVAVFNVDAAEVENFLQGDSDNEEGSFIALMEAPGTPAMLQAENWNTEALKLKSWKDLDKDLEKLLKG